MYGKKEAIKDVNALILSCEQGISGEWDCSQTGFEDMIATLYDIKKFIKAAKCEQ